MTMYFWISVETGFVLMHTNVQKGSRYYDMTMYFWISVETGFVLMHTNVQKGSY
jgi:hypothetical protein